MRWPAWVSVTDASIATGVPARTIRRWIAQNRLTTDNESMPTLIDPCEVEQLRDLRDTHGKLPRLQSAP